MVTVPRDSTMLAGVTNNSPQIVSLLPRSTSTRYPEIGMSYVQDKAFVSALERIIKLLQMVCFRIFLRFKQKRLSLAESLSPP